MEMDWKTWIPKEKAVLCFVIQNGQILLIHKKRGFGAGKINGPGGRIDPGETALQAAIRETQEEIGITPKEVEHFGELHFQFKDGYSLQCGVFRAENFEGELIETDEALAFWCQQEEVPYDRMWQDDALWLPLVLQKQKFEGYFLFEGEKLLSKQINLLDVV